LPIASVILLAPNGMNRIGLLADAFSPALAARLMQMPFRPSGTRVAARCVAHDGTTTYVDPDQDCAFGAARHDVFVLPEQNVAEGLSPGERLSALQTEIGSAAAAQLCAGLDELRRAIDGESQQPGPAARLEELLSIRQKAMSAQQRLLC
jgi:hypothetical protein